MSWFFLVCLFLSVLACFKDITFQIKAKYHRKILILGSATKPMKTTVEYIYTLQQVGVDFHTLIQLQLHFTV